MANRILQEVISMLLCGLQRFINLKQQPSKSLVKLEDPTNATFKALHNVVECRYRELHEQRVGAV